MYKKVFLNHNSFLFYIMIVLLAIVMLFVPHGFREVYEHRELESSLQCAHAQGRLVKYKKCLSTLKQKLSKVWASFFREAKALVFNKAIYVSNYFEKMPPWQLQLNLTLLPYFHCGKFKWQQVAQP